MGSAHLKEELYHLIETGDRRLIKMLYAVAKEYTTEEPSYQLEEEMQVELNSRVEKYEREEMKFSSWDAAKDQIRKRAKDAL